MKKFVLFLTLVSMCLLAGCQGWQSGSYHWMEPHAGRYTPTEPVALTPVMNYAELRDTLTDLADDGMEGCLLDVDHYEGNLEEDVALAVEYATKIDPVGAFAISEMEYQFDRLGSVNVVMVKVDFRHTMAEIDDIVRVRHGRAVNEKISEALDSFAPSLTLWISGYQDTDFHAEIEKYCDEHPDKVMEYPSVLARIYPDSGTSRVVELEFTYQTPRNTMRTMQESVETIFSSAEGYVSFAEDEYTKASRLSSFLMELYDYVPEETDTPSYSLLCQGIGDSRAYANVFAAMCQRAGVWCQRVDGTRNGEDWSWNILRVNGNYCYVDLLGDRDMGKPYFRSDSQMKDYHWVAEWYPICAGITGSGLPEETEPEPNGDVTEPTIAETAPTA